MIIRLIGFKLERNVINKFSSKTITFLQSVWKEKKSFLTPASYFLHLQKLCDCCFLENDFFPFEIHSFIHSFIALSWIHVSSFIDSFYHQTSNWICSILIISFLVLWIIELLRMNSSTEVFVVEWFQVESLVLIRYYNMNVLTIAISHYY